MMSKSEGQSLSITCDQRVATTCQCQLPYRQTILLHVQHVRRGSLRYVIKNSLFAYFPASRSRASADITVNPCAYSAIARCRSCQMNRKRRFSLLYFFLMVMHGPLAS
ncbi:hypothetical protein BJX62DRAFT_213540 [Aspergillus germanicus]